MVNILYFCFLFPHLTQIVQSIIFTRRADDGQFCPELNPNYAYSETSFVRCGNRCEEKYCQSFTWNPIIKECAIYTTYVYASNIVPGCRFYRNPNYMQSPCETRCNYFQFSKESNITVFQQRCNGFVDFFRNWIFYENGFGYAPSGEFWKGNKWLNIVTSTGRFKLRVELLDFDNIFAWAEYTTFTIGPPSDYYRVTVGGYTGNAGDGLNFHNGQKFSTYDNDQDQNPASNEAQLYNGAWWYYYGHRANLNALYKSGVTSSYADSVGWEPFKGHYYSLKCSRMMLAPF